MNSDRPPHLRLVPESVDLEHETGPGSESGSEPHGQAGLEPLGRATIDAFAEPAMVYHPEELFRVLAIGIRGTAVGWPPDSLDRLEAGLLERFGGDLGSDPEAAVARLVILARNPAAA